MIRAAALTLSITLACLGAAAPAVGQDASPDGDSLVVGVKPSPPFIMVDAKSGEVTGFSIDLMHQLAAHLNPPRNVRFVVHDDITDHLDAVLTKKVDLGIAATTITSQREQAIDFSQPFYRSGLDIAVPMSGSSGTWDFLQSRELQLTVLWLVVFLLTCAHLIWLAERGSDAFSDHWLQGVGEGMWWTIVTMSTVGYGDFAPKKPLSRLLGVMVIFAGIILFGVAVASFSSALTIQQLSSDIRGPSDLQGERVSVVSNTTAALEATKRGAQIVACDDLAEAVSAVENGRAAAVVHDRPQLLHLLGQRESGVVSVGASFAEQGYGICFPYQSLLREQINVALLQLMEGDPSAHQQLCQRWFGGS